MEGKPTLVEGSGSLAGGQGVYPGPRHGFSTLSDPHSNPKREHDRKSYNKEDCVLFTTVSPVSSKRSMSIGPSIRMAEGEQ